MICPVCKETIQAGHTVIRVPVICRAEQSTRDYTRIYLVPLQPTEEDVIHYHCMIQYLDPTLNLDLLESAKDQVREQAEAAALSLAQEQAEGNYDMIYDEVLGEFERNGWLSEKYVRDHGG